MPEIVPINLKVICMIRLLVYNSRDAQQIGKPDLERILQWDSSVRFPFEETTKVMKAIYGPKSLIVLEYE